MVAHALDDVEKLHLKSRIARHAAEGTEKTVLFGTQSVVVARGLDGTDEIADGNLEGAGDLEKPLEGDLTPAELEVRQRSLGDPNLARQVLLLDSVFQSDFADALSDFLEHTDSPLSTTMNSIVRMLRAAGILYRQGVCVNQKNARGKTESFVL